MPPTPPQVLLVVWFAAIHGPSHCRGAWKYDVAVGGLLGAFALSFVMEACVVREGLKGAGQGAVQCVCVGVCVCVCRG